MKETVNVSIASQAFTVDEDAWRMLDNYLKSIRDRLEPDDNETIVDVETRIADLFRENLPSPIMVVSAALFRRVIEQIVSPDVFGSPHGSDNGAAAGDSGGAGAPKSDNVWQKPLRRSADDRVLAGVCGGIARHFDCDSAVLRLVTLLLIIFGGLSIWIYIILWLVIPAEPKK